MPYREPNIGVRFTDTSGAYSGWPTTTWAGSASLIVNDIDVERTLHELLRRVADLETHIAALKASTA